MKLVITKRTDKLLLERMKHHYSQPKGFVGRNICYAIIHDNNYYGHIVAGSATKFLPNRNEYFGICKDDLNHIINNIFFNVSPINGKYPYRNFTPSVIKSFVLQSSVDWKKKYGDDCYGFETLVEKPRTGELYLRAGWEKIGETKGFTCKRIGGTGTDSWSGRRVWDTNPLNLRPKNILCYRIGCIKYQ